MRYGIGENSDISSVSVSFRLRLENLTNRAFRPRCRQSTQASQLRKTVAPIAQRPTSLKKFRLYYPRLHFRSTQSASSVQRVNSIWRFAAFGLLLSEIDQTGNMFTSSMTFGRRNWETIPCPLLALCASFGYIYCSFSTTNC